MLAGQASGSYHPFPVTKHFLVFPDQSETPQKLHVFYRTTEPHMKAERQTDTPKQGHSQASSFKEYKAWARNHLG